LAVNGIPIFNPLNNRGEDALAIGELDDYGGHCGRADDYHYHVAPLHLEKIVGKGMPIAYALDGYPVYGSTEPDGSPMKPLDACGGHEDGTGGYHYHALEKYPYLIGAFHGEVTEREGQVDPQPRAQPVRPALPPLRGATIVGFEATAPDTRKLVYEVSGRKGSVEYTVAGDGSAQFTFIDPSGRRTTESYASRPRGGGGPGGGAPRPERGTPSPRTVRRPDGAQRQAACRIRPDVLEGSRREGLSRDGLRPLGTAAGRRRRGHPRGPPRGDRRPRPRGGHAHLFLRARSATMTSPRWGILPAMVCALAAATAGRTVSAERTAAAGRPPNVIVILMDDMGWRDVGFAGNTFVETPHLDRLARDGIMFTQAYASAPNCAPTRACLMSGQYTPRHGIYTVVDPRQPPGSPWHKLLAAESRSELATEVVTLPEALASRGYATGFFGMWNLGRGRSGPCTPGGQGFDTVVFPETLGFSKDAYFADDGGYLSDRLTDAVLSLSRAIGTSRSSSTSPIMPSTRRWSRSATCLRSTSKSELRAMTEIPPRRPRSRRWMRTWAGSPPRSTGSGCATTP
jgi:hypothetical protein